MSEVTTEAPTLLPGAGREAAQEAAALAAQEIVEVDDTQDKPGPALTKDDVAGKSTEKEGAPDRELVAPSIREFLRAGQPAPEQTALEKEIADLREALDGIASNGKKDEPVSVEQKMLAKLEALEKRDADRVAAEEAAREEEAYNNRVKSFQEGVIANVNAKPEEYAGLIALEQQEVVFNALVQRTQDGIETSEDEIASEVEAGLKTVYETLHKVYGGGTPSKDSTPSSERKVTLTPGLAGSDEASDIENMSRSEKIEYLWNKTQTSQ